MTQPYEPTNRDFMSESFGDSKLSKEVELNASMSIQPQAPDELENKMNNVGGSN